MERNKAEGYIIAEIQEVIMGSFKKGSTYVHKLTGDKYLVVTDSKPSDIFNNMETVTLAYLDTLEKFIFPYFKSELQFWEEINPRIKLLTVRRI